MVWGVGSRLFHGEASSWCHKLFSTFLFLDLTNLFSSSKQPFSFLCVLLREHASTSDQFPASRALPEGNVTNTCSILPANQRGGCAHGQSNRLERVRGKVRK